MFLLPVYPRDVYAVKCERSPSDEDRRRPFVRRLLCLILSKTTQIKVTKAIVIQHGRVHFNLGNEGHIIFVSTGIFCYDNGRLENDNKNIFSNCWDFFCNGKSINLS